jgi:hypothetical protein
MTRFLLALLIIALLLAACLAVIGCTPAGANDDDGYFNLPYPTGPVITARFTG